MILMLSVLQFVCSRLINRLTMASSNIAVLPLPVGALTTMCFSIFTERNLHEMKMNNFFWESRC